MERVVAPWRSWRVLRVGLVAVASAAATGLTLLRLTTGPQCESTSANPYGCLGWALLVPLLIGPLLGVVLAAALAGKGLWHCTFGAGFTLVVTWQLMEQIAKLFPHDPTTGQTIAIGVPLFGIVAAAWAAYAPGRL